MQGPMLSTSGNQDRRHPPKKGKGKKRGKGKRRGRRPPPRESGPLYDAMVGR